MNIYLLRHAKAKKRNKLKYPNDDRPLAPSGIKDLKQIAKGIRAICKKFDLIISSPMQRCLQTAKGIKEESKKKTKIHCMPEFLPGSNIKRQENILLKLANSKKSILVVGHEPDLSVLTKRFTGLCYKSDNYKKGGISLIMLGKGNVAKLKLFLSPDVLIRLGAEQKV